MLKMWYVVHSTTVYNYKFKLSFFSLLLSAKECLSINYNYKLYYSIASFQFQYTYDLKFYLDN